MLLGLGFCEVMFRKSLKCYNVPKFKCYNVLLVFTVAKQLSRRQRHADGIGLSERVRKGLRIRGVGLRVWG